MQWSNLAQSDDRACDTNILVRYFVQNDVAQCLLVNNCIDGFSKSSAGLVSTVTLCELVWILEGVYATRKPEIILMWRRLLEIDRLVIENKSIERNALSQFSSASFGFGDAIIAQLGKKNGCSHTLTFNKCAAKTAEFLLLK